MTGISWTDRERKIVAYFYHKLQLWNPSIGKNHPAILKIYDIMSLLNITMKRDYHCKYHSPGSIYAKVSILRGFDERYPGVGLKNGSRSDKDIWQMSKNRWTELEKEVLNLIEFAKTLE